MINDSSEKLNNMATLSKYTHHSSTKISCFSTAQSLQNGSDEAAALLPENLESDGECYRSYVHVCSKGISGRALGLKAHATTNTPRLPKPCDGLLRCPVPKTKVEGPIFRITNALTHPPQ